MTSLAARNALSALLLVVAIVGIVVKVGEVHRGIVDPMTRFVLAGYVIVVAYALASIGLRVVAARNRR